MSDQPVSPEVHGFLGGILAALRHLVMVTPAAHSLSVAVDRLAEQHAAMGPQPEPQPETEQAPPPDSPAYSPADHSADALNAAEKHDIEEEQHADQPSVSVPSAQG